MRRVATLLILGCIFAASTSGAQGGEPVDIGNRRELFLDDLMIDRLEGGARREMRAPVPREVVMTFDRPWEGNTCLYTTVFQDGDLYRMYYRGSGYEIEDGKLRGTHGQYACYAESRDGIHWTRPSLGLHEFDGSTDNNIILAGAGTHNITVFRDENPQCAPEARYKAVGFRRGPGPWAEATKELIAFQSADGIHWAPMADQGIISDGAFDSQNTVFWDTVRREYRAFYRYSSKGFGPGMDTHGRDIKTATTQDFLDWPEGTGLTHLKPPPAQFYTNVIRSYHRAPHLFIGMPAMYHDRGWTPALEQLPDLDRRRLESDVSMRSGTALTDTLLMWSRDGVHFERSPGSFLRPGPERPGSWMYGDHFVAWHIVETESPLEGAAPVLTFYASEFYRKGPAVQLRRYTLRLDGFASIHAPIEGGELVTPPLVFDGSALSMNFATSAFGSLRVEIQDAEGTPIPGFTLADSIELYGDTVARNAMWEGDPDLGALAGRAVRLRFVMRDADLYSVKFE